MRSTHGLFHGISSANLAGNLPFFVDRFVRWRTLCFVTSLRTIL